jgi:hypothetical protein
MHVYRSVPDALELGKHGLRARSKNSYRRRLGALSTTAGGPSTPAKVLDMAPRPVGPRLSGSERVFDVGESSPEAMAFEVTEIEVAVEVGGVV